MRLIYTLLIFSLLYTVNSQANIRPLPDIMPSSIQQTWQNLNKVGTAKYSKYGFKLYKAELWSSASLEKGLSEEQTYGLSLKYKRNIKQPTLLKHTNKQWLRLNTPASVADTWIDKLEGIWPNIKKGDILSCIVEPQNKTTFFLNNKPIGEITDTRFGLAFLNIWLNEKSAFKKQRKQLLGG